MHKNQRHACGVVEQNWHGHDWYRASYTGLEFPNLVWLNRAGMKTGTQTIGREVTALMPPPDLLPPPTRHVARKVLGCTGHSHTLHTEFAARRLGICVVTKISGNPRGFTYTSTRIRKHFRADSQALPRGFARTSAWIRKHFRAHHKSRNNWCPEKLGRWSQPHLQTHEQGTPPPSAKYLENTSFSGIELNLHTTLVFSKY